MKSLDEARKPAKQDEEEEIHQYTKLINRENYSLQSPPILLSLFRTRALRLGPIPPRNTLNSIGSCCSIGWYQVVVGVFQSRWFTSQVHPLGRFMLQVKPTALKVEPASGCLSQLGKQLKKCLNRTLQPVAHSTLECGQSSRAIYHPDRWLRVLPRPVQEGFPTIDRHFKCVVCAYSHYK
jgi:hypothetical protein